MSTQLPIISTLNESRYEHFRAYNNENTPAGEKITSWALHKLYAVVSFPANLATIGIGSLAATASACTIGAAKVAIFAITLGNIRSEIPTGVRWLVKITILSIFEECQIIYEIGRDIHSFCNKCIEIVKNTLTAVGVEAIYLKIQEVVIQALDFIKNRLKEGSAKAWESENGYTLGNTALPIITSLNNLRSEFKSKWNRYNQRSFTDILAHTTLSTITLPLNAFTFACSTAITCCLSAAFFGKVLIYATTNINLPFPVFISLSDDTAWRTGSYLIENTVSCIEDMPIILYQAAKVTGVYQAILKISDIVSYIPEAVFANG